MSPAKQLSKGEFVALMAMTFAMVAFSIDAMLPALPEIAQEISPGNRNRTQLILTSFVFGMGLGTFFTGPLSDRFGRKTVIAWGTGVYIVGSLWAASATSMEAMITARILQGLGVAGPRIVSIAIVRDLYDGRLMAQIMSYIMLVFTLVPALAPLIGAGIIAVAGWRAIFVAYILFAVLIIGWLMIRQPETLPPEKRRPFKLAALIDAVRECFSNRIFTLSTITQALAYGMLFGALSSTQQIFDQSFGRGDSFPMWFALIAVLGGLASIINARLVLRLGMRRMILLGFGGQAVISGGVLLLLVTSTLPFAVYLCWATSIFFMAGLVIGNLNALAMEPVGHIAGLAASVIGSVATVSAVVIAVPIGLAFDGTPAPLAASFIILSLSGFGLAHFGLNQTKITT